MKIHQKALLAVTTLSLAGCYVVPIGPDGNPRPLYAVPVSSAPVPPTSSPVVTPLPVAPMQVAPPAQPAAPAVLHARLYPLNDIATQTGVVGGTVTNMMSGKGVFQLSYKGDVLSGEATRVAGDVRKGVASAYGPGGSYMSCDYQMYSPYQGAGTCTFSNGARYQVHISN